ncbi:molybdopterin-binding oxidoreductase [Chromatiales bacterium (ex Bugula neritina AB1)]|nr:molybdopterin-binding oxidoreductase [Chromatiales bacterium (ex Bugula neritina AB1)]
MQSTSPDTQSRPSVCPLDCPDCCSLNVSVVADKVVAVHGSAANSYTDGVICNKVTRYYPEFVHGEGRLTKPLQRTGKRGDGQYREITWDKAFDLVYEGFSKAINEYGSQSVMPFNYAGPHGELAGGSMDCRFFHKLGATRLERGPLCGAVRGRAYTSLYGAAAGMPPEQAVYADLIVVWGNNVTVSNLHLIRVIKTARESGARLIVIDPKRTKVAEQSDLFLAIHPGTDVVFAMAVAAELERRGHIDTEFVEQWTTGYEQYMQQAKKYTPDDVAQYCRISREQFDEFIDYYISAKTVAVSVGNGIERGKSGGSGLRAAMALQALTGNHGRVGAGVLAKAGLINPKTTDKLQRPDLMHEETRIFNIVDVSEKLLSREMKIPVKAIMIYNHNPVCTHPDQQQMIDALSREDLFIVGCDIVMTDSMQYADVILPAASHFEYADIYGSYGQNYLQRAEPAIPCVGESLPNTEIFRRLAKRFGFDDPVFCESDEELMDAAIDGTDKRLNGLKPSEIPLTEAIELKPIGGGETILCDTVLPQTPSGKIELYCEALEQQYGFGVPRFEPAVQDRQFVLISPSSSKRTNATFGGCADSVGVEVLEMNPADASTLQLDNGAQVLVRNDLGEVNLKLVVTDAVRPGVLYSPKGTWLKTSATGRTVNALIDASIRTDIESGACYNETFVSVESAASR